MDTSPTITHGTLLAVDGHSLAFRAFFALPVENFTTKEGQPTNAVYGFLTMLAQVIEAEHPDRIGIAFDVKGGTFRNELLGQYKGTREAAPQELLSQLPLIQQALEALGVRYVEQPGYEGDDVIATLATMGEQAGYKTLVLSGDRDAFQLIDDHTTVKLVTTRMGQTTTRNVTPEEFRTEYGFDPIHMIDLKALMGDTSDNYPGVKGVGEKTAMALVQRYETIDALYAAMPDVEAKPAAMPEELLENAGYYGSLLPYKVDLTKDGTLTMGYLGMEVPPQTFTYHDDGSFRDQTGTSLLKFIQSLIICQGNRAIRKYSLINHFDQSFC